MLRCIKPLTLNQLVVGQYTGDPDGTTKDAQEGYLDDPTVNNGESFSLFIVAKDSLSHRITSTNQKRISRSTDHKKSCQSVTIH